MSWYKMHRLVPPKQSDGEAELYKEGFSEWGELSNKDCGYTMSLLRRSRSKLVHLFFFSVASPRNDFATIGVLWWALSLRLWFCGRRVLSAKGLAAMSWLVSTVIARRLLVW